MKKIILKSLMALTIVVVGLFGWIHFSFTQELDATYSARPFTIAERVQVADLELGKRLFHVRSGCVDCHGSDLSGVRVMDDPAMGSIYGANITPFNLSSWSDEEIATAIRYGIHKSGRSLRFMPTFDYVALSIDDIAALVAYLKSVSPVEKPSHQNTYGPVAKLMAVLGKMPVMFPAKSMNLEAEFGIKPEEGPTKEFGAYLASACVGCHGADFAGGKINGGDPAWPEAADIRLGANPLWSKQKFQEMMVTGVSPISQKKVRPPMPMALLAQMNDMEITALWEYLSSLN